MGDDTDAFISKSQCQLAIARGQVPYTYTAPDWYDLKTWSKEEIAVAIFVLLGYGLALAWFRMWLKDRGGLDGGQVAGWTLLVAMTGPIGLAICLIARPGAKPVGAVDSP